MTLIAAWKEQDTPCLVGDLVVSTLGPFDAPHSPLATRGDLNDVLPREWCRQIVSTCQKVYRVSDSLAIGWSGTKFAAGNIVERIFSRFSASPVSLVDLKTFFGNETDYTNLPCTIIGWVLENGSSQLFRWNSNCPEKLETATILVEGSGSDHFRHIFDPTYVAGTGDAVRTAVTRIANILGHEVLYGTNLWNLYGGGFEIIYLANGKFRVLPSVTFNFLYAKEEGEDIKFGVEKRILKTLYRDEIFHTLALLVNRVGDMGNPQMHYTFPIYAKPNVTYSALSNLSLESEYYAFYFDIICRDDLYANCVLVVHDSKKDPFLKIVPGSGTIEGLALGEPLFRQVVNFLKQLDREALKQSLQK